MPCLLQDGGGLQAQVLGLAEGAGHRRVHDHGKARLLEPVQDKVAFGHAVEDELDLEFLGQAQDGEDVARPVNGHEKGQLTFEHADEGLGLEAPLGLLALLRGGSLARVLLGLHELGAQHRDHLGPRPRRLAFLALRGPAHRGRDHGYGHHGGGIGVAAGGLHDHGLSRYQGLRAVPGVQGRDPVTPQVGDETLLGIVGVDGAELGLDGRRGLDLLLIVGLVQVAGETHDRVGVDEAGRNHLGAERAVAGRDRHLARPPHLLDLAVLAHQDHSVAEGRAGHRVDGLAPDRRLRGGEGRARNESRGCGQDPARGGHSPSSTSRCADGG